MSLRMMRHPHERHRMIIVRRRSDRERTGLDGMGFDGKTCLPRHLATQVCPSRYMITPFRETQR
jgi:hypothetical protein